MTRTKAEAKAAELNKKSRNPHWTELRGGSWVVVMSHGRGTVVVAE